MTWERASGKEKELNENMIEVKAVGFFFMWLRVSKAVLWVWIETLASKICLQIASSSLNFVSYVSNISDYFHGMNDTSSLDNPICIYSDILDYQTKHKIIMIASYQTQTKSSMIDSKLSNFNKITMTPTITAYTDTLKNIKLIFNLLHDY